MSCPLMMPPSATVPAAAATTCAVVPPAPAMSTSPKVVSDYVFNLLDTNKDGVITRNEFVDGLSRQPQPASVTAAAPCASSLSTTAIPQGLTPEMCCSSSQCSVRSSSPGRPITTPPGTVQGLAQRYVHRVNPPVTVPVPPIVGQSLLPQVVQPLPPSRMRSAVQLLPQMVPPAQVQGAAPTPLLSRIDTLLSDMERELADDLRLCAQSPLRRGGVEQVSRTGEGAAWLDDQISAIERRREACEVRQSHLHELRRIVAEANDSGKSAANLEKELDFLDASELLSRNAGVEDLYDDPISESDRLRTAMFEKEIVLLKAQVEELESERLSIEKERQRMTARKAELESQCQSHLNDLEALANAVASEERRAQVAEESANQQVMQAAVQTQAIQEQLREVEAAAVKHREISAQAEEAQAQAEDDLRTLEENSRAVLNDCRALQSRVRELENERSAFTEIQTGWEEERNELHLRIRQLEEERLKLESYRRELVDDKQRQRREQESLLLKQEEDALKKVAQVRHREKLMREELLEVTTALETAKIEKQHMEELNTKRGQADRSRIKDLEQELLNLRQKDASSRSELQRVAVLEQELADAKAAQAKAASERARLMQLQQELEDARAALAEARANAGEKNRIMSLEEQIRSLRAAEVETARKTSADKARIAELDKQLSELLAAGGANSSRFAAEKAKIDELTMQLQRETEATREAERRSQETRMKIAELEEQLEIALRSKSTLEAQLRTLEMQSEQKQASSQKDFLAQLTRLKEELRAAKADEEAAQDKYQKLLAEIEERETHVRSLGNAEELPTAYAEVLELVERDGWDAVNWQKGFTILHWAAQHGKAELCTRLMSLRGSPYAAAESGKTPIDLAREAGHSMVVTILQQGAPPEMAGKRKSVAASNRQSVGLNHDSAEALHASLLTSTRQSIALNHQSADALQSSLQQGVGSRASVASSPAPAAASSSFANRRVSTVSHLSEASSVSTTTRRMEIPERYKKVMEQIEEYGWDKMQWKKGFTLLHWAAKNDRDDLCGKFMFQKGDPNQKDDNGMSPIDYARANNATDALSRLEGLAPEEDPFMAYHYSNRSRKSEYVVGNLRKSVLSGLGADGD